MQVRLKGVRSMDISEMYKGKNLKAEDLNGDTHLTITDVESVEFDTDKGPEPKAVVHFLECEQGLVLNKINFNTIRDIVGGSSNSEDWKDQRITIFPSQTGFQGKQVPCIRVKLQAPAKDVPSSDIPF